MGLRATRIGAIMWLEWSMPLDRTMHNLPKVKQGIEDYISAKNSPEPLQTSVLETALYLEDSFGIRLADDEMSPEFLGTREKIENLVKDKLACAESAE